MKKWENENIFFEKIKEKEEKNWSFVLISIKKFRRYGAHSNSFKLRRRVCVECGVEVDETQSVYEIVRMGKAWIVSGKIQLHLNIELVGNSFRGGGRTEDEMCMEHGPSNRLHTASFWYTFHSHPLHRERERSMKPVNDMRRVPTVMPSHSFSHNRRRRWTNDVHIHTTKSISISDIYGLLTVTHTYIHTQWMRASENDQWKRETVVHSLRTTTKATRNHTATTE